VGAYARVYERAPNSEEFRRRTSLAPPLAEFWSALQPELLPASRKSDGGAAEGSISVRIVKNNWGWQIWG